VDSGKSTDSECSNSLSGGISQRIETGVRVASGESSGVRSMHEQWIFLVPGPL